MPGNVIAVHVGQGGNQIGFSYWRKISKLVRGTPEERHIFRESKSGNMVARAVIVDTEEGVIVNQLKADGNLSRLFPNRVLVRDADNVEGSANNWAVGYHQHGVEHPRVAGCHPVIRAVKAEAAKCERLAAILVFTSLAGGTGSGLGSYILEELREAFPKGGSVRLVTVNVIGADVTTAPYNVALSLDTAVANADLCILWENGVLAAQLGKVDASAKPDADKDRGFDRYNEIIASSVAQVVLATVRPGLANLDWSDLDTLVPWRGQRVVTAGTLAVGLPDGAAMATVRAKVREVYAADLGVAARTGPVMEGFIIAQCGRGMFDHLQHIIRNPAKTRDARDGLAHMFRPSAGLPVTPVHISTPGDGLTLTHLSSLRGTAGLISQVVNSVDGMSPKRRMPGGSTRAFFQPYTNAYPGVDERLTAALARLRAIASSYSQWDGEEPAGWDGAVDVAEMEFREEYRGLGLG